MRQPTVIVYVRLSRDSDASTSIASQTAACEAYAKQRGWKVVLVAEDVDVSGASKLENRPGMSKVLDALHSADYVLAVKLDRYSRSVLEFALLWELTEHSGATLVTVDGTLGPESSRFMANILAAFAEHERETIRARINASKQHLRSVGRWLGGAPPYGFKLVRRDGGTYLDIDPGAAAIVRDCVEKLLYQGASLSSLMHDLNERGILPPADHARKRDGRKVRGSKWSTTTLRDILITPAVRGFLIQSAPGKPRTALNHQPVLDANGEPHKVGPELLDADTWTTLRETLDERAVGRGKERTGKALLLHVAECSECQGPMYHQKRVVSDKDYSTYVCPKGVGKHGEHASNIVQARGLETLCSTDFLKRFGGFSLMHKVESRGRDVARELRETDEALDNLAGNLSALPAGGRVVQAVISQIEALEKKRVTLLSEAATPARTEWVDSGITLAQAWAQRTTEGRNAMLREFGAVVKVAPLPKGAERRFSEDRAEIIFEGPEWWRSVNPAEAALMALALEEELTE
ncbi:recombinase family protein [Streptomyces sp. NPDC005808]|uniref:recombinase family protein n=1 Tax=Streptomyces sp. NPDC005808 TaxID=3364734 RepID=UPI003675CF4F